MIFVIETFKGDEGRKKEKRYDMGNDYFVGEKMKFEIVQWRGFFKEVREKEN